MISFFDDYFELYITYIFPMVIYVLGLSGNVLGIFLLATSKMLDKLGPKDIYTYLFVSDSVYLSQLIINYFQFGWGYDATILSSISCKLYQYFQYSTDAFSPFLIAYISIERLISFRRPRYQEMLTNRRNQFVYFFVVVVYNCLLYLPFPLFTDVFFIDLNSSEPVYDCTFVTADSTVILNYLDIANRVLMPFLVMTVIKLVLFHTFHNFIDRTYRIIFEINFVSLKVS